MWSSAGTFPHWIRYEFDAVYKLHELWVWNSNQLVEAFVGLGAKDVRIEYSTDGQTWAQLEGMPEFAKASGMPTYTANTTVDFGGVMAKFVKLTIETNWGGIMAQTGLSEVRFFYVPVQAFEPDPADGATDIPIETQPELEVGQRGDLAHGVHRQRKQDAVADGSAPVRDRDGTQLYACVSGLRRDVLLEGR